MSCSGKSIGSTVLGTVDPAGVSQAALGWDGGAINGITGGSGRKGKAANPYGKLGKQYLQFMNAYGAGLPQQLDWQQKYQPAYTNLSLANTNQELNGSSTQPGYLSQYENNVVPAITRATTTANTALRTANANDLTNLAPGVVAAIKGANPAQTRLTDTLTSNAEEGLVAGNQLTADQMRTVTNAVNQSNGARGVNYGPAAAYQAVLANSAYGDNLYQQRQQNAGVVAGMNDSMYTTPAISAVYGANSSAPASAQPLTNTAAGIGASAGPSIFSGNDSTSAFNAIFNQNAAANIASKNNNAALCGSGISGGTALGGAAALALL